MSSQSRKKETRTPISGDGRRASSGNGTAREGTARKGAARGTAGNGTARKSTASTGDTPADSTKKPLLGSRVKNDLMGLAIAVFAVVLLVIVVLPSNAVGAKFVSDVLHLIFGQGALLLPFLLLGWAATFFVRRRLTNSPVRLALGLGVIYLALISAFAMMTPQATADPGRIFDPALLVNQGGYIGGALAWALLSLVGQVPTAVILIGLILVGLVLIGLSITGLVDWVIQSIKNLRKPDEDQARLNGSLGNGNGAAPQSGSAYQMGPDMPGVSMMNSGAYSASQARGAEALLQPTSLRGQGRFDDTLFRPGSESMGQGQFDDTLYRPGMDPMGQGQLEDTFYHPGIEQMGQGQLEDTFYHPGIEAVVGGDPYDPHSLGFTRRRMAHENGRDSVNPEAVTMLLSQEDMVEGTLAGAEDEASSAQLDTIVPTEAEEPSSTRKKRSRPSSNKKSDAIPAPRETSYTLPSMQLLRVSRDKSNTKAGTSELRSTANRLQETLEEFHVDGDVVGWIAGPTVTLYKLSLGEGVRLNRITALQSDIQLALAAQAIRIVAPVPGTSLVGIEIPNAERNEVLLGDVLGSARDSALALAIGKDVEGASIVADLASMPHLLIGGTTGSGKSVAINSIIMSLLMRTTPEEVRLILIDPKRVELTLYNGTPHLYVPVVTDAGQAASALAWCVAEMDRRLKLFEKHAVKNIRQFNTRVEENLAALEKEREREAQAAQLAVDDAAAADVPEDFDEDFDALEESAGDTIPIEEDGAEDEMDITVEQENLRATLPYLVIVIDELADLMMLNGKEVEATISRLAQLARAAGLHLVVATQRPSTNVITGLIKANIVNRIAFTVASGIDSRVILDTPGAEDLIGLGDMLFSRPEYSKPVRIQGCLVSEPEIETVVEYWRAQGESEYHNEILLAAPTAGSSNGGFGDEGFEEDPLLWPAAEIVVTTQLGSTSTLQRRLKVGYARAGRIMDMLEMKGVVGPPNGSKPREVLVDDVLDLETLRAFG